MLLALICASSLPACLPTSRDHGAKALVPVASAAEQQQQYDDQQHQAEPAAIVGAAIVAGAVAVVPASTEQEQDDEDQQNKAHEIRLSFVRRMRLAPSRV